jgi:polyphosphate:AMP phosphotransferase
MKGWSRLLEKVDLSKKMDKDEFKQLIGPLRERMGELQRQAKELDIPVIIMVEGWDAAGKGTIVNQMIPALDPRGFVVFTTYGNTEEDSMRPPLWAFWLRIARRGRIVIFDRSWYTKMVNSLIGKYSKPDDFHGIFEDVASFERQLADDGTLLVKFFLHISKAEQKERLKKLEADKLTSWRVTAVDWKNHKNYEQEQMVVEEMLRQTDTEKAPWTIVEAHDRRFALVKVMTTAIQELERHIKKTQLEAARQNVQHEPTPATEPTKQGATPVVTKLTSSVLTDVDLTKCLADDEYREKLKKYQERIRELGYECFQQRIPVVVVFEGWDAAGKGGCIRKLTENMDHRGYTVVPIGAPTEEEKEYHYLWRFWKHMAKAGHMVVFDRSWYGRVLVERVEGFCQESEWRRAYKEINEMEEQWHRFGAVVVKFWLQIDKEMQKSRFEARLANPERQWKITGEDWRNREKWDMYEQAVDEMFFRTSTVYAPWTIVEANSKNYARIKVLETIIDAIEKRTKEDKGLREKTAGAGNPK